MKLKTDLTIHVTTKSGSWYAATGVSPFFCFEGPTEKSVLDKARKALRFYHSIPEPDEKCPDTPRFETTNRVRASELEAA